MITKQAIPVVLACIIMCVASNASFAAGSINPPTNAFDMSGNPISTMKSISEIEPRYAISSIPYSITNSGAYYLTKSLVGSNNANGITVAAIGVDIDMNGFVLTGAPNSMNGIEAMEGSYKIDIRNGFFIGWDQWAINLTNAGNSGVADIICYQCNNGISTEDDGHITDSMAIESTNCNFLLGRGSVMARSASRHSANGIIADENTRIRDCYITGCGNVGISALHRSVIENCTIDECETISIDIKMGCMVKNNTISGGATNTSTGILVNGNSAIISGNNISDLGIGIENIGFLNRIEQNHITYCDTGIISTNGGGVVIQNSVGICSNNYVLNTQSMYGPIVTNTGSAFTNSNPWINFDLGN